MRQFMPVLTVLSLLLAAVLPRVAVSESTPQQPATRVSVDEFDKARRDKDAVVIDVRSPEEFAAGHIPGAVNIPVTGKGSDAFEKKVASAVERKKPLLYCRSGVRSLKAAEKMQAIGIKSIVEMPGGWVAWSEAGKEVEKGNPPAPKP